MSRFDLKYPPPVVLLACVVLITVMDFLLPGLGASGGDPFKSALASLLGAGGLVLVLASAAQFLWRRTTVNPMRPEKTAALVTDGLYAYSRNPIYVGDALILAGFGIYMLHLSALPVLALFLLWIDRFQIQPEERALRATFGAEYEAYCQRVRRWI